ncbi:MAG TPA: type VI secretion system-associated FHA domain protein TagH [Steroidobacteraceae bacterium]|jgi:type VI secretion system protein|nr:type VI secretion system-associated FHA domain protein TagH [Steroidobacteraceae bacterium]
MALRLRVVSDHRRSLGDRASIVFGVGGGTIGRSADNDWVLPDPLRYVSAHHARISFRQGAYVLEDLSTNGVYVNDAEKPLGKQASHKLQNGDLLRFGDYQVAVAIDAEGQQAEGVEASPNTGSTPGVPTSILNLRTVGRAAQTDIGASLDLDALLIPDTSPPTPAPVVDIAASGTGSGAFRPVNAYGQAVARIPRPVETTAPAEDPEPDEQEIARRIAKLARAVERNPRADASAPALYDVQSGLQAFCRGAGIDAERLPKDAQTRLMHVVGQLFREAFVGLKDLERSRNEVRNRFRIEIQQDADDPRPSLGKMTLEDLLVELLHQHEVRRLDAVQWLREAMTAARDHDKAVVHAIRDAFVEFVGRLDPAELEARFERAARRGKLRSGGKAEYWDLYAEFYRNLVEKPAELLPHTFVEAFSLAYREFLRKPRE